MLMSRIDSNIHFYQYPIPNRDSLTGNLKCTLSPVCHSVEISSLKGRAFNRNF